MANLKEQFFAAPNRIQDGVLYLILEAAICLTFALFDVYHGKCIWTNDWTMNSEWCFVIGLGIIFAITLLPNRRGRVMQTYFGLLPEVPLPLFGRSFLNSRIGMRSLMISDLST